MSRPELPLIHLVERLLREGNRPGAEAAFSALPDTVYQRENARERFVAMFSKLRRPEAAALWDRCCGLTDTAAKEAA